MKKRSMLRLFTLFLTAALMYTAVLPVAAAGEYGTVTGTVLCGDEEGFDASVDLTQIRVEARVMRQQSITSGIMYSAGDVAVTASVNEQGEFSFPKDAEMYWVEIARDTLPEGYGVTQHDAKVYRGGLKATFTLLRVATIDVAYEYNTLQVSSYDKDGKYLFADCNVILDPPVWAEEMRQLVGEGRQYATKLDYIDSMTERIFTWHVAAGDVNTTYTHSEDWSGYSMRGKVDTLYKEGVITEEERIDMYCDMLLMGETSVSHAGCIVSYPYELTKYVKNNDYIPPALAEKLIASKTKWEIESWYGKMPENIARLNRSIRAIRLKTLKPLAKEYADPLRQTNATVIISGQLHAPWSAQLSTV